MDFRSFDRWPLAALLVLAGLLSCANADRPLKEQLQAALDDRFQQCAAKGASVAVVLPDGTLWRGVSGISHEGVQMQPDMAFAIGSITKNMVAVLVLQLAEEGRLSLGEPISRWLPDYPHVDGSITIRQMLNHTSGLFMFWDNQKIWDDLIQYRSKVFTAEEILGYLKEPYYPAGEGYRYSNTNYLLAAMIITRVTGSTLSAELRRRFWEPLGLESARLAIEEPYPENMAHVWGDNFENDGSYRDITFLPRTSHDSITYGSAGVFMTAEDLARWTHALFQERIIRRDSLEQMLDFTEERPYGLGIERFGWRIGGRLKAVGHGGGNIGTTAYMFYLPDHEVSISVMINQFGSDCASRIVRQVARVAGRSVIPESFFSILWSIEGLLSACWLLAGLGAVFLSIRKNKPVVLILFGGMATLAGAFSTRTILSLDHLLLPGGAVLVMLGLALVLIRLVRQKHQQKDS